MRYDNETGLLKFQNIPYAREPTGNLRFRAPEPPLTNRSAVQTGSRVRVCPQGIPIWQAKANPLVGYYSSPNISFNLQQWETGILHEGVPPGDVNAIADENCLLLDVHVSSDTLKRAKQGCAEVPVLVFVSNVHYPLDILESNKHFTTDSWRRICSWL